MKYTITTLLLCIFTLVVPAQNRAAQRPAGTPVAAKPRGQLPYVIKKDYDSSMTKLNNQIRNLQGSLNQVRGGMNGKDAEISTLRDQMKSVEEVLNSTNFKIANTSDSLSKTQMSLEEIQKANEVKFEEQNQRLAKAESTIQLFWGLIILAIAAAVVIWFLLSKQIKNLEEKVKHSIADNNMYKQELRDDLNNKSNQLEVMLRNEGKSSQHFAERLSNANKEEISTVKSSIQIISSEITEINTKLNSK